MTSFSKIEHDLFFYAIAMGESNIQSQYIIKLCNFYHYIPDDEIELKTTIEDKIRELAKYYKKNFTIVTEKIEKTTIEHISKLVKKV